VFAALPPGENGTLAIDPAQLSPRYGRTLGELAASARGMIADRYEAPGGVLGFRLLIDGIPQDVGRREFFSGIKLSPGGEARRMFEAVADSDLQQLHREAMRRRNLQAILERAEAADPSDGRFLADVGEQTRAMQPERAGEVLLALAERYQRSGRWEMACECYALVVDRYPEHPLAGVALAWLIQYHASGEIAWRTHSSDGMTSEQVVLAAPLRVPQLPTPTPGAGVHQAAALTGSNQVQLAGGVARDLRANPTERFTKVDNYSKQLEQLQPALAWEPAARFPWAAAQRELGLPRQAERFYLGVRQNRPADAWRDCALTELWLIEPKSDPPKSTLNCPPTIDKPRLDGRLDEPLWNAGNRAPLKSALGDDSQWPAVVMLAYDREYLYVGVSCTRAAGVEYVRSQEPRPRDPDLSNEDRVELLIDVDRDFATYYRLSIDHRGRTGESCWGDKSWNPKWFVASGESDNAWTAEAAIAWSDLASEPPTVGKAWAVGIQRVVPGVGFQSWTTPAAVEPIGEGFGYLMFR
jgi:tetratricopeptide (TPR) repeat protein